MYPCSNARRYPTHSDKPAVGHEHCLSHAFAPGAATVNQILTGIRVSNAFQRGEHHAGELRRETAEAEGV